MGQFLHWLKEVVVWKEVISFVDKEKIEFFLLKNTATTIVL